MSNFSIFNYFLQEKRIYKKKAILAGINLYKKEKIAREKLSSLLGLEYFNECELCFKQEFVKEHSDYTEIRFTYQSEAGVFVPCHFLKPHGATREMPVVICLQGHSTGMHISLGNAKFEGDEESIKGDRDFCIQAVKEGIINEVGGMEDAYRKLCEMIKSFFQYKLKKQLES